MELGRGALVGLQRRVDWRRPLLRRPGRFLVAPWIVTALVLVLVVSGLPVTAGGGSSESKGTAASPATTTPGVSAGVPKAHPLPAERVLTPNRGACLLGMQAACAATPAAALASAITPAASTPSNWKNMTPKAGAPNPPARYLPAMAYYPDGHEVVMFGGGYGFLDAYNDTWGYSKGNWTELVNPATCTNKTCPSARVGAMLAYDPTLHAMILFGGFELELIDTTFYYGVLNDTWEFANNTWTNITATAGNAPSPRWDGAMIYDPSDNYILLFGGENVNDLSLADTWTFSTGTWRNISSSESLAPGSRAGAAIAASPSGYIMLFGGQEETANYTETWQNPCNPGGAEVAWWFYHGKWSQVAGYENSCIAAPTSDASASPTPDAPEPVPAPPCGRIDAALGWSPKNARFVLYGGYGPSGAVCGSPEVLNDSWTYALPAGGGFYWDNASSPPGPPAREEMGYATDFTSDYFEIFGGFSASDQLLNSTWRFYEVVYAKLSGPQSWNTGGGLQFQIPFVVIGYGGTGALSYSFAVTNSRTSNELTTGDCDWFYNSSSTALPFNGTENIHCIPAPKTYGVYHLELTVTDENNSSHPHATANWTFIVVPPEKMVIYSEYAGDFYTGVDFSNTFTIYAEVANDSPSSISATLGGQSLSFSQSGSGSRWWNATGVNMGSFSPGATLQATANFPDWTVNDSSYVQMVATPTWLGTLFKATGAHQSVKSSGAGPFNKSYVITEEYDWSLSNSCNFSFNVPLVGGNYGLVPTVNVTFNATSEGNLSVLGTFSLTPPTISIPPVSLKLTASIDMSGTFDVVGSGVQWGQAQAAVSVSATLNASIPIYGFSLLGCNVGFTLQLSIQPSITLEMILAPLQAGGTAIIPSIAVEIQKFLGSFTLALAASINFGIAIASIGLGIGISVAVAFQLNPFSIQEGWVNGSIFVTAQFLWWSDSFNIVGPATIATFSAPTSGFGGDTFVAPSYNNGTTSKWTVQVEYYKASDYDGNVWNPASSSGPAISDIYPWTQVAGAAAYNGPYLFYTDANVSEPETYGLIISGAHLSSSTNALARAPGPYDAADYEVANPVSESLPNGDIYVLWTALPTSEAYVDSPLNLTSIELQGATFYPANGTWGPVRTYSAGPFAESYQVSASRAASEVLELTAGVPLVTNKAPERLVEYDLATGAIIANVSTSDISSIVSFRASSGLAVLETLGGNYSLVSLPTGGSVALGYTPPAGYDLISATFAGDSATTLVLLYRGATASELVLYDTATSSALATLALGQDYLEVEAIVSGTTTYVFARTAGGIQVWTDPSGTFSNLTDIVLPGVVTYGLVQVASSILVYALAPTGGNSSEPIRELELTELGASLPALTVPSGVPNGTTAAAAPDYALYLGVVAGAVVALLAVVAILTRRRGPRPPPKPFTSGTPPAGVTGEGPTPPADAPTPPAGATR